MYPTIPSPTIDREIQVHISERTGQTIPIGGTASFHCSGRSLSPNDLRITWSRENGNLAYGRARDDGRGE